MRKPRNPLPHSPFPRVSPEEEIKNIDAFFQNIKTKTGRKKIILGISGGIDSATSFNVIARNFETSDIIAVHLPYYEDSSDDFFETISPINLPPENIILSPIKDSVDAIAKSVGIPVGAGMIGNGSFARPWRAQDDKAHNVRLGNIMARVRMIHLFDLAKKLDGLVCGTENRSEYYLGYFTRFGDAASDIEPIAHLYKTEIRALATYLGVPKKIVTKAPSAGLWDGQTDEEEMGFTYEEADLVLYYYFDQKKTKEEIMTMGYSSVSEIISRTLSQSFKHEVPYCID